MNEPANVAGRSVEESRRRSAAWLAARVQRLTLQLERHALLRHEIDAAGAPQVEAAVRSLGERIAAVEVELAEQLAAMTRTGPAPALQILTERFDLSGFEADLFVLAAGAELDPRVGELCGILQDDRRRSHSTVGLAVELFVADPAERLLARDALMPVAPLRRFRLIRLDESDRSAPLASRRLRVDERVIDYLRGVDRVDESVSVYLGGLSEPLLTAENNELARRVADALGRSTEWPVVNVVGPADSGGVDVCVAACRRAGLRARGLDLRRLLGTERLELTEIFALMEREAALSRLAFIVEPEESPGSEPGGETRTLAEELVERLAAPLFVVTRERFAMRHPITVVAIGRPSRREQTVLWRSALARVEHSVNGEIDRIVQQFDLGPRAIADSLGLAGRNAALREPGADTTLTGADLWRACRERATPALEELAQRIEPHHGWADIVLPDDARAQLREIADQVSQRPLVYETWNFAARLDRGRGITALFAGPSGTGKTMAAEILARELELDLFSVDLSGVVSKYIGETEKNLRRLFDAAERTGAILFFDEADALFGTRSEVRDSHDRYANIEVDYLLQRMERYSGLAILATNRRASLDEAFLRRLRFSVDFPFPSAEDRRRIWESIFPAQARLDDLDVTFLAGLEITGGSIRSISLNAAFLAAAEGRPIGMTQVMRAARRDYAKNGRTVSGAEFGPYHVLAQA